MRFHRLQNLIGSDKLDFLSGQHVMVFGLGGVGSFAAEALVRSGIGKLTVIDYDVVDITNINRQLVALESTIGQYKVDVFYQRAKEINPDVDIKTYRLKADEVNIKDLMALSPDYILDCVDDVGAKIALVQASSQNHIPMILAMGFANKFHPEMIEISTVSKTSVCPLAKAVRKQLRDMGLPLDIPCVFSKEKVATRIDERILGSTAFCPSSAGLMMASYVINDLLKGGNNE